MSNARLLEAPLAPPKRQSITKAAALQWAENELATMCSDEHTRYEQFFEGAKFTWPEPCLASPPP